MPRRRRRHRRAGTAVVHGVLRLGSFEPVGPGAQHHQAGCRRLQDQGLGPRDGDRPHRHVGPDQYNMALSLRRANAVKDALVREGVPATAIAVDRPRREQAAGADRRRCARAAEPPRRSRGSWTGSEDTEASRSNRRQTDCATGLVAQSLTLTASATNSASLVGMGVADSRQNAAPRIQFSVPGCPSHCARSQCTGAGLSGTSHSDPRLCCRSKPSRWHLS